MLTGTQDPATPPRSCPPGPCPNRDQSLLPLIQPLSGACWTLSPLFVLGGRNGETCCLIGLGRLRPLWTDCVFNILIILVEHVQILFFRVQKMISCLLMFADVQHVQHVLSLFRASSQGLNMLNMQSTVKMAFCSLIMFHFSISR